jgi:flagella basal body P-ring formation protein FlgA
VNQRLACVAVLLGLMLNPVKSVAEESAQPSLSDELSQKISQQLGERIAHSRIHLPSLDKLAGLSPLNEIQVLQSTRVVEDKPNGVAVVEVVGVTEGGREIRQVIQTPYEAWIQVPTAAKRIYPNTKLKPEDFRVQEVNVATGMPREYRGVLLEADAPLAQMESRQTILEGQFVTRTAVQRQPDIRKGEMVKLELVSGDLSLVTQAIVQEPGSIGERIRVLTLKTKKEIVGKVRADRTVEVSL